MYLVEIHYRNARRNGSGGLSVQKKGARSIPKWTFLPGTAASRETLQLMVLSCAGIQFIPKIPLRFGEIGRSFENPLEIACVLAPHAGRESRSFLPPLFGYGIRIIPLADQFEAEAKKPSFLPAGFPIRKPAIGSGNSRYFVLGYGSRFPVHGGSDDFDFNDPFFRVQRFNSLFCNEGPLTDPVAFLHKIHYKARKVSRYPAMRTFDNLSDVCRAYLDLDTRSWLEKGWDVRGTWEKLRIWQKRILLPVLDAVRHVMDASPLKGTPLDMQGLLLFDRPDHVVPSKFFPRLIHLLDALFPRMQFVCAVSQKAASTLAGDLLLKRLSLPNQGGSRPERRAARMPKGAVLLVDVDGRLPNLALMKLSRHYKEQGRKVVLARKSAFEKNAERVYASCIFSSPSSQLMVQKLRQYYESSLVVGGSGVDLHTRLAEDIEALPPDYSLYPELGERAIGFLTRGCPFHCAFCVVPEKEGPVRKVSDLHALLENGKRRKLILLDDNLLSHPDAEDLLEEMAARKIQVNFNQTLDIRLLNSRTARLLRRIRGSNVRFTRNVLHFSMNDTREIDLVREKYAMLGFTSRDNAEFICMYGFNTTLAEDVRRFRFLRSLPGAYLFVQQYRPVPGGPPPHLSDFWNKDADRLINELISIQFTQNMKSMEKYYRWVSKRYANEFGKLHPELVKTIFRYNNRHTKGRYVSTLAGTRKLTKDEEGFMES
jgi:hypothetical protein